MYMKHDGWRINERQFLTILENAYKNHGYYVCRIDTYSDDEGVEETEYIIYTREELDKLFNRES